MSSPSATAMHVSALASPLSEGGAPLLDVLFGPAHALAGDTKAHRVSVRFTIGDDGSHLGATIALERPTVAGRWVAEHAPRFVGFNAARPDPLTLALVHLLAYAQHRDAVLAADLGDL